MAQEQQQHIVSSSDSERSRNVKLKKKIPQRGLGVAQLEKIRMEELMKKEVLASANAIGSVTDATPSPSPVNFRSSNTLYRSWSADHDHRNSNAAGFRPPMNFHSELNASASAAALPSAPQRFFRFQQPASPVVNPYSSSAFHMEPPSSQNHLHCNSYASSSSPWPEMVGVKRPYPFFLESPPEAHSESRYDELASCGSGYAPQKGPRNVYTSYCRDGPTNSNTPSEQGSRRTLRDDGRLDGDFLTLALPPPNSKHAYAIDDFGCQWPEDDERRQGNRLIASRSMEEPFNFFPVRPDESGGEKGEAIDLNLKL
ncbi:uncharacterized protein LOC121768093 [Salvia splendens]|nr:uncharacterized protein LOC121768093 [Salvia splendens]XP_042020388.1 uncharacterized protein LOC121768093 [Salvia splendens]XP_042020389.1 uncharacterized protein LOC121768093 [Salvia splendens]XP_042020390.1 uncharacterized protein LOC121768093 [Salvia splendens]